MTSPRTIYFVCIVCIFQCACEVMYMQLLKMVYKYFFAPARNLFMQFPPTLTYLDRNRKEKSPVLSWQVPYMYSSSPHT